MQNSRLPGSNRFLKPYQRIILPHLFIFSYYRPSFYNIGKGKYSLQVRPGATGVGRGENSLGLTDQRYIKQFIILKI